MELFELDINALSKGKKEAFFILYHKCPLKNRNSSLK